MNHWTKQKCDIENEYNFSIDFFLNFMANDTDYHYSRQSHKYVNFFLNICEFFSKHATDQIEHHLI